MLLSKYAVSISKKSRFTKEQEARGLLSSLGIKTPLSSILLVGRLLFQDISRILMNEIVNTFLLAGFYLIKRLLPVVMLKLKL